LLPVTDRCYSHDGSSLSRQQSQSGRTAVRLKPLLHVQFIAYNKLHAINCTCNNGLREPALHVVTIRHPQQSVSASESPHHARIRLSFYVDSPFLPSSTHSLFMAALRTRCGHYILQLWFLSFFFFFSSPILSGRRLDVYYTCIHDVALVRI